MKKLYLLFAVLLCLLHMPGRACAQGISSIASGDATSVVDALGTLYVSDAYKEADVYFFAHFTKLLNNHPELKVLFPATVVYLDNVPNYQYTAMLPTMRAALYKDLKKMPWDITQIALLDPSSSCLNANDTDACKDRVQHLDSLFNNTEDGKIVVAALMVADGAINNYNAATVLNNIASFNSIRKGTDTVSNILRLLNVVSKSLLNKNGKTTWITPDTLGVWITSGRFQGYINKLSDSMATNNVIIWGQDVAAKLQVIGNDTGLYVYFRNLVAAGLNLDTTYNILKNDKVKSDKPVNTALFLSSLDQLLDVIINYHEISPGIPPATEKAKLIYMSVSSGLEVSKDIITKDYQSAVFTTTVLLDSLLETIPDLDKNGNVNISKKSLDKRKLLELAKKEKQYKMDIEKGLVSLAAMADSLQRYYASLDNNGALESAMEDEVEKNIEFKQNLLKYLGFAANVAAADSMPQVVAAIEAVALPPGSSIIKKTTHFSIAIQGYAGIAVGATGAQLGSNVFGNFNSFSPYAPLGVSFNWDLKSENSHNKKINGSLSLYLSIIDIGGIVGYDFKNQNSKAVDTVSVKWQNVFAPGANVIYGIPGMPLSIGAGFEYQPSLQWINNAETTSGTPGFRWQIFAAFDLPFLDVYVSKR